MLIIKHQITAQSNISQSKPKPISKPKPEPIRPIPPKIEPKPDDITMMKRNQIHHRLQDQMTDQYELPLITDFMVPQAMMKKRMIAVLKILKYV